MTMKIVSVLFAAGLLATSLAFAQDSATPPSEPAAPAPAPKIACDAPVHDFGKMDNSQQVEHEYVLKNVGTTQLEISNVRPSCGCTVANISERSVAPGAETRVLTRLNLQGRSGPQHKAIVVESNDPQQPQFILTLQGEAVVAVNVMPDRVIFGQLSSASTPATQVQVTGPGEPPFKIVGIESSSTNVLATFETAEEGKTYRVNISGVAPFPEGQLNANVRVFTDHPARPVIDIPVVAMVVGDIVVAPQELVIAPSGDESQVRYVLIRTAQGQPFTITAVETPDPSITTQVLPFGDNGYRLQVDNLKASSGVAGKNITVRTDLASRPEVVIPIRMLTP